MIRDEALFINVEKLQKKEPELILPLPFTPKD